MPTNQNNNDANEFPMIYESINRTKDDRFNADRRLQALDKNSLVSLSAASTALVILSILPLIPSSAATCEKIVNLAIPSDIKPAYDIFQICMPIILLVVSIIVSFAKYGARAEKMHRCGLEINTLKKQIDALTCEERMSQQEDYTKKYEEILSRYEENHQTIDHELSKFIDKNKTPNKPPLTKIYFYLLKHGKGIYFYKLITLISIAWPIFVVIKTVKN